MKDANQQMMNTSYTIKCTKQRRCRLFKACEPCARIRQADIATRAEKLNILDVPLFFSVFKPHENTEKAIKALRASILRRKLTVGGLWTVEKGEKFGQLHLNLISPELKSTSIKNCTTWSEAITTSTRSAASYISKQKGIPADNIYSGQLYGTFGQIFEIAIDKSMPAVIQASAIELMLTGTTPKPPPPEAPVQMQQVQTRPTRTQAEYHLIAKKHLANLMLIANSIKQQNQNKALN